jgi:cellulose synthase (UDP-forming)
MVRVDFVNVDLPRQRQLVELLFCRPGQWKRQDVPNELVSLWLLLQRLLFPKALFGRREQEPTAIAIGQ